MKKNLGQEAIYDARTLGTPRMLILGLQHLFAMFGATVLVPILVQGYGLPLSIQTTLLMAGLGTLLFHVCTKFKVPAFLGSSFAYLGGFSTVATLPAYEGMDPQVKLSYALGGIVIAGLLAVLMAVITSRYAILKTLGSWIAMLLAKLSSLFGNVVDKTVETTVMTELTVPPTTMPVATGMGGAESVVHPVAPLNKALIAFYVLAVMLGGVFTFVVITTVGMKRSRKARTVTHYEDEITSTRKESRQRKQNETQKEEPIPGWLSPTKRIRRRYKRLMEQHPDWLKSSTARENLVEEAAKIYEKTRYSSHTVTKQDADEFKNKTK